MLSNWKILEKDISVIWKRVFGNMRYTSTYHPDFGQQRGRKIFLDGRLYDVFLAAGVGLVLRGILDAGQQTVSARLHAPLVESEAGRKQRGLHQEQEQDADRAVDAERLQHRHLLWIIKNMFAYGHQWLLHVLNV